MQKVAKWFVDFKWLSGQVNRWFGGQVVRWLGLVFLSTYLPIYLSTCFTGCRKKDGKLKEGEVELEYMMWGEPDELKTVTEYLKQFEEKFPKIKIKILHTPQNYDDKLKTMFAAHTPPDVMYVGLETFPSFATRGVLLDLNPYLERDKQEFNLNDFYPELMKCFEYDGKYYGIAKDFTPLVLYYNKDMFDKMGVKYPNKKGGWKWADFLDAAKKLTVDFNNDGKIDQYGFVLETWFQEWAPWVWQNDGKIMSDDKKKWLLGSPEYIDRNSEAVQFLADLVWKHNVAPRPTVTTDFGTADMFMTGKVAMCTYGRWMCMQFRHIKDFKWDIAPLPYNKKRAATLFVVCYGIANESKHKEEAWQLIKYLMSKEGQELVAEAGHAIPSLKSVAKSDRFLKAKVITQPIDAKVYLDSIKYAQPTPTNPYWVEINELLGREIDWVWQGKKPAKEVLETIQPQIENLLSKYYVK
ncbi:MAG: sugar ABC transporter substrate-binding protein [Elusimicrobiota bacterium]